MKSRQKIRSLSFKKKENDYNFFSKVLSEVVKMLKYFFRHLELSSVWWEFFIISV